MTIKNPLSILLVLGITLLLASTSKAAPSMSIEIDGSGAFDSIGIGDTVTVALYGDDIPVGSGVGGDGLFGFGFTITFDDSILDSSAAIAGPLWVGTGFTTSHNDPGDVGMTANRFFMTGGPDGDDILLATIDFTGLAPGLSSLTVGYYTGASGDNVLFDNTVLDGSPSFFQSGSIEVVPEPTTALLLGMGLTLLAARRRNERLETI